MENEKHCFYCKYLEEIYKNVYNKDYRKYEYRLDEVICTCPEKDDLVKEPCEYFDKGPSLHDMLKETDEFFDELREGIAKEIGMKKEQLFPNIYGTEEMKKKYMEYEETVVKMFNEKRPKE